MTMTLPTLLLMTGALLSVTCLLPVAAHTMLNYRQYHSSQEIHQFLRNISRKYPTLTHLYDIGESQKGEKLTVIAIGRQASEHVPLRPHVNFIANMHGNELVGREMMLRLIENITKAYVNGDHEVQRILNSTLLHILVTLNPDGSAQALKDSASRTPYELCNSVYGRSNINGIDLNRNFPDVFEEHMPLIQKETEAIMHWITLYNFVITINFHGGALVVNYPFDNYKNAGMPRDSPASKSVLLKHMSSVYAENHPTMHLGLRCYNRTAFTSEVRFPGGITNGAEWYPITGGMQDYIYTKSGSISLTVEMSCCKQPPPSDLPGYWKDNYTPLLEIVKMADYGIKGYIRDGQGRIVNDISIIGEDFVQPISSYGEYFILMEPGTIIMEHLTLNISGTWATIDLIDEVIDRWIYKDITLYSGIYSGAQSALRCNTIPLITVLLSTVFYVVSFL